MNECCLTQRLSQALLTHPILQLENLKTLFPPRNNLTKTLYHKTTQLTTQQTPLPNKQHTNTPKPQKIPATSPQSYRPCLNRAYLRFLNNFTSSKEQMYSSLFQLVSGLLDWFWWLLSGSCRLCQSLFVGYRAGCFGCFCGRVVSWCVVCF